MQIVYLSTTGNLSTVIINDLGGRTFTHPVANVNLLNEYPIEIIRDSVDLQTQLTAGNIVLTDGLNFITSLKNDLDLAAIQVDTDSNGIIDNSEKLNSQTSFYYLDRTNHSGTQPASSISNFDTAVVNVVSSSGTSGYALNAGNAFTLGSQNSAFYLNRTNHTGTQLAATISDFNSTVQALVPASSGTSGWATNAANAYLLNNQLASFYAVAANTQPLDATLTALAAYNTSGILTQTAADTFTGRTITGTTNKINVTNGNGVAGNPTLTVGSDIVQITQANVYGDFDQSFRSTRLRVSNPANTFFYNFTGTAIAANRTITLPLLTANDIMVTEAFTQTLTNKTLTSPVINTQISGNVTNGGNITTTNFLIGATATQTMSAKTLTSPVINTQISGTVTSGGNITTTNFLIGATATQTMSAKTLTAPIINTSISGDITVGGDITNTNYLIGATATQTLSNKTFTSSTLNTTTLTAPTINTSISGDVTSGGDITTSNYLIGATATQTLSNKTMNAGTAGGGTNVFVDIPVSSIQTYFQLEEVPASAATASTTAVTRVTLVTPYLPAGKYRVIAHWMWLRNSAANSALFDITLNGVTQGTQMIMEAGDTTDFRPETRILYLNLSGVNTILLRYWGESGANSTTIANASIEIQRVL